MAAEFFCEFFWRGPNPNSENAQSRREEFSISRHPHPLLAGVRGYTPDTLALMGHHRRILLDSEAGVYRYDELIVLRRTSMPAVLLEAGSIVNRQEELELGTSERRSLTSAAVVAAVENFCAARARPPSVRAAASTHRHDVNAAP